MMPLLRLNWSEIDTVLLDMDGTILDLSFDDYIWNKEIPKNLAKRQNIKFNQAVSILEQKMKTVEATLNWYCFDFWEKKIDIDINSIEEKFKQKIKIKKDAITFLTSSLLKTKQMILVTNADKRGLIRKLDTTGIRQYFDDVICSHDFNYAKEEAQFWSSLRKKNKINFERTLLIDDNLSILNTAEKIGIRYLRGVSRPNSKKKPIISSKYQLVDKLSELIN